MGSYIGAISMTTVVIGVSIFTNEMVPFLVNGFIGAVTLPIPKIPNGHLGQSIIRLSAQL
jgi:hypothetical protein